MLIPLGIARTVLYHESGFLYPIGNTPAQAVLPAGENAPQASQVLLLGCGDVRNALVTAAALHKAGARTVDIHMNDIADSVLARDVLLLAVACTMDPASGEDVGFLWSVWFNACLSDGHRQRLNELLQQAIAGRLPSCIAIPAGVVGGALETVALRSRLQHIWQSWLECSKTAQALAAERKSFMLAAINRRQQHEGCPGRSWQEAADAAAVPVALDACVVDSLKLSEVQQLAMSEELKTYFLHGSILGDGMPCLGPTVNPTLLDAQGKWRVHDLSSPFLCFPPFTHQQLLLASKQLGSTQHQRGMLTRAAQAKLAELVANYQHAAGLQSSSRDNAVLFVMHGGDGLALCGVGSSLGDSTRFDAIDVSNMGDHVGLLNVLASAGPRLSAHPGSRLIATSMTWTSSNKSSILDYLTAALGGHPRLLPTMLGLRLVTETRFGKLEAFSLHDRMAARASNTRQLEFAPAVASAIAAFPTRYSSSSSSGSNMSSSSSGVTPARTHPRHGPSLNPRLQRQCGALSPEQGSNTEGGGLPFALPNLQLPPQPGSSGLADALLSMERLCCASFAGEMENDRSGLLMHTPSTLARVVSGAVCGGRLQLRGSSTDSLWQQLLALPDQWQLASPFQLAWRAAWHRILQAAASADSNSSSSSMLVVPPKPVVYTGSMQPSEFGRPTTTPMLRLVLLTQTAREALTPAKSVFGGRELQPWVSVFGPGIINAIASSIESFLEVHKLLRASKAVCPGVVIVDSVAIAADPTQPDKTPLQVSFVLPADHGLDPNTTTVGLMQQQTGCLHCLPMPLANFSTTTLDLASSILSDHGLVEAVTTRSTSSGSGGSKAPEVSLIIKELVEDATSYTAVVQIGGSKNCSGLSAVPTVLVPQAGQNTHEVVLSVAQPAGLGDLNLRLLHPIDGGTAKYTLSRGRRTITAVLPKSADPDWPCDVGTSVAANSFIRRYNVERDLQVLDTQHKHWGMWMTEMFDHTEVVEQMRAGNLELGDPFRDLRGTIKIFFIRAVKGEACIHQIINKDAPPDSDEAHAMYVRVHMPLRRHPDSNRPLAVLTVVDNVLGMQLLAKGKIDRRHEVQRFQEIMMSQGSASTIYCSRRELQLLRALLTRNSRRTYPTKWQTEHLSLGPDSHWMATFICPVYPEVLGDSRTFFNAAARTPHAQGTMTRAGDHLAESSTSSGRVGQAALPETEAVSCRVCGARSGDRNTTGVLVKKLMRCSRCKSAAEKYCSVQCQKADWSQHKKHCHGS